MGSVTIIVIIPLAVILILASSLIGAITGGDRTEVVLPYEPEKGIVWDCDIPIGHVKLVETEIDGETQVFYFKSTHALDVAKSFVDIAKSIITKEYNEYEYTYGECYKIIFTDQNGNEQIYYADSYSNSDSIYFDLVKIYSPDEYFAFDYTFTAQQPIEGEYGWYNQFSTDRTVYYKPEPSPTKTVTIIHTNGIKDGAEYYYEIEYGPLDGYKRETEFVKLKYTITDGEVEILEENHVVKEQSETVTE